MKLLLDMNMSTRCVNFLADSGFTAMHWSTIGNPQETHSVIMGYALQRDLVIVTFDLDFGTMLSATSEVGPSVILIRPAFARPEDFMPQLTFALVETKVELMAGALVIVEQQRIRVRPLPL